MEQFTGLHEPALVTVNRMAIREIQINALEAAAEIVNKQLGPFSSELNWQVQQAILAEVAKLKGEK